MPNMTSKTKRWAASLALAGALSAAGAARASDHLDTPTVIADPRADIGDIYAWMAPDGKRLNLVMTIVGHTFSDKLQYVFHIDSGPRYGATTASVPIVCAFASMTAAECRVGDSDYAHGDPSDPKGLDGDDHRFRVFAGLRDDPFFNNVKGTRAAYNVAAQALKAGPGPDAAGCAALDAAGSKAVFDQWSHTDGGPAKNFLAGWTPASIVLSVDVDAVATGGKTLAVWAATIGPAGQIDRMGRPLTGNALLGTIATAEASNGLKEAYNAATPATSGRFVEEIEKGLQLYDGFDGKCGDQLLYDASAAAAQRYRPMATLLADDRLWINGASSTCTQLFAVELAALPGHEALAKDCGGRAPTYDAVNVYRSLLVDGSFTRVSDGLHADEVAPSDAVFPFLAAPEAAKPEPAKAAKTERY
jgi:hypothetical protein